MSKSNTEHILRAWRDPEYFNSLSAEERAALPANPASAFALDDSVLESVTGGGILEPTSAYCTPCPPKYCY
ncbi:type 2 lantibiotic, mersacidin/lichenicidin family [Cystobacter fuscus]|uniref:Type 2 lantibiotic, mersacidin/lichenicidin family n=1 Tax=Cystobacter fuscus TaxID=43 RepID=A0A250JDZ1_9BACT|nr:mersacidin/lichenicidin family type 2 lantibiotic [Cystobacter fuscus]ATB41788.1 type 2 lantibiotic, mersacidin/lichenicidin family [Cystobacter fuscus]